MRILILNWKDVRHPLAGGAERVTHEYAKHLVLRGHNVTIFTSHAPKLKNREVLDGVEILRHGNIYSVHLFAFFYYVTLLRKQTDVIIDQVHGIPFFTPLYSRKKLLVWVHEVADTIWFKEFIFPIAILGWMVEQVSFKFYRNRVFLTDSASTEKELMEKLIPKKQIVTIPLTIRKVKKENVTKSLYPSLIYVGRLVPMKRLEILIKALHLVLHHYPQTLLYLVGQGKSAYQLRLQKLIHDLDLKQKVTFLGHVPETQKIQLLAQSWLHVNPSLKEGFGITTLEAAAAGTPTLAFSVPGLRETVINNLNGYLIRPESYSALSKKIVLLFRNTKRRNILAKKSLKWSKALPSWREQTSKLEVVLNQL